MTALASPTSHRHDSVIRRYFDGLFNEGRLELASELLAPDHVNHSAAPGLSPGREGVVVVVQALRRAFPDLHYKIIVAHHRVTDELALMRQLGAIP